MSTLAAARAMRRAGHAATAIQATTGISRDEARSICTEIPLGWDSDGFFSARPRGCSISPFARTAGRAA